MSAPDGKLSLTVSCDFKVNLGNYESCSFFAAVSNITEETTQADVDELLANQGEMAMASLRGMIGARVRAARERAVKS